MRQHGIADVTIARAVAGSGIRPGRLIVGVAPDGVRAALVRTRDATASVPVVDEVFVLRDATVAPPDAIVLR
jgi:hypothetical protein